MPSANIASLFNREMASHGLEAPEIIADGQLHRFRAKDDRPGTLNGWYVLHLDAPAAGAFGSWKSGIKHTWCSVSETDLDPTTRARLAHLAETAQRQRNATREARQASARVRAATIWDAAQPAPPHHPYLIAKGIQPHGARIHEGRLVVPVMDHARIESLQFIGADGSKRFLRGGRKAGCWYEITGSTSDAILVCEGFSTGATLAEDTGCSVFVAFDAGNLLLVAKAIRAARPCLEIILAADNDAWTPGNPGVTKARAAAKAVGGRILVPDFAGLDQTNHPTDWNDWRRLQAAGEALQ